MQLAGSVASTGKSGLAAPLVFSVATLRTVGVDPLEQVPPDPGQYRRVEPGCLGYQPLLDGGDLFGFHRRWQFLDDTSDDLGVFSRDRPVGLRGRHGR